MTWPSLRSSSARCCRASSSRSSTGLRIAASAWFEGAGIASVCVTLSTGCDTLPPVAPPGEPRMVLEAQGKVRLAAFDEAAGEFVDLGWHDAAGLRGWTIADYEW